VRKYLEDYAGLNTKKELASAFPRCKSQPGKSPVDPPSPSQAMMDEDFSTGYRILMKPKGLIIFDKLRVLA
jgi:hypothetical protein